jgi:chromosome segregation ATPase
LTDTNTEARIRELERELLKKDSLIEAYKHEQYENTSLIGTYEDAVGTMTEQIRNYCLGIEGRFLDQRRHYNDLLQQEKDEHLQSRLDRDHWHAQTLKVCEMIRKANRLRTDEWCEEYAVVAGLQGEVRCYRRVLGMDVQKPEEEGGWPYLKDLPLNDKGPI